LKAEQATLTAVATTLMAAKVIKENKEFFMSSTTIFWDDITIVWDEN
jgi:hypothetical protein